MILAKKEEAIGCTLCCAIHLPANPSGSRRQSHLPDCPTTISAAFCAVSLGGPEPAE